MALITANTTVGIYQGLSSAPVSLDTPLLPMDLAAQILMSVLSVLMAVPKPARTHQALTPAAVSKDILWMLMDEHAMMLMSVFWGQTDVLRTVQIRSAITHVAAGLGTP